MASTTAIIGKFKRTGPHSGICRRRNQICGYRLQGPTPGLDSFIFPDYYSGPYPKGAAENSDGRMEVKVDRIIPLDDGCADDDNNLNAIILFK